MVYLRVACCSALLICLAVAPANARIGEERRAIEERMLLGGHGIVVRELALRQSLMESAPYWDYVEYLPKNHRILVYYKQAEDGPRPSTSDLYNERNRPIPRPPGWMLHVVYGPDNESILEYYERSQPLTKYEIPMLLELQKGDSYWQQVDPHQSKEAALGITYVRQHDGLRAHVTENSILFYKREFGETVQRGIEENKRESAPLSVKGF